MTPEIETIATSLLRKMTCPDAHRFIVENLDPSVQYSAIERVRKRLSKQGKAYLRPVQYIEASPILAPLDRDAARKGSDKLRKAIWAYHAKHAPSAAARENYAKAARL